MVTNQQRDNLIQAHIKALTTLGVTYQREFTSFLMVAKRQPSDMVGDFIFNYLPLLNRPFQGAAGTIGERFLNLRAQQSGVERLPNIRDFGAYAEHLDIFNSSSAGLMKNLLLKQRDGLKVYDSTIVKSMERSVVEADRAVTLTLFDETSEIKKVLVGVRGDGCSYCKSLSAGQVSGSGGDAHFHNNCRCVFDPQFKNDPKFSQPFHKEFNEQYSEAEQAIKNGEVPPRVVSVGSKEWEAETRRELVNTLQGEPEQVNAVMEKVLTGEKLDARIVSKLESNGLPVNRLYEPLHKEWQPTQKDIIKLMESQNSKENYRLEKKI